MARGLFAVLEDELSEIIPAVTDEQAERVEELEEQVAQGEVVEAEAEVQETGETVDEAIAAIEELSDVAEVLEGSVEEGEGLSEDAAEIAEVAVEAICNRLGYKPEKKVIPAMESFGGASSRMDATKYALEGVKETIMKIWEAIANFFKSMYEKIKGLWAQLLSGAVRLQARAKTIREKVSKAVASNLVADKETKIEVSKYLVAFNSTSGSAVKQASLDTMVDLVKTLGEQGKVNSELAGLLDEVVKSEQITGISEKLEGVIKKAVPGKLAFGYEFKTEDGKLSVVQNKVKVEKTETEAVSLGTLNTIATAAFNIGKAIQDGKENISKAESTIKKAISLADKLGKSQTLSGANASEAKAKADVFRKAQTGIVLINSKVPSIALKAGSVGLDFVSANLGAYKAAEAAK